MQEFPALLDPTKMAVTLVIGHWSLVIVHIANQIYKGMNSLAQ